MGTFTTSLKLGGLAFGVIGGLDPMVKRLTVGQIRVIETLPKCRFYENDACYKEEYMCVETGVGSGQIWDYGKNIFATEADALNGAIKLRQAAHKARADRDKRMAEAAEQKRLTDLAALERLKRQYETAAA